MTARTVMGHELEYALIVIDSNGRRLDAAGLGLMEQAAASVGPNLPWEERGLALPNGARFYRDPASDNAHLEYATPEITNPDDLVAHIEAGNRFLLCVAAVVQRDRRIRSITVGCNTVDYSAHPGTCGSHESYLVPGNARPAAR
jgi:Pup-ligase protein